MSKREISITSQDRKRLEELLAVAREFSHRDRGDLQSLAEELQRSHVVDPRQVPSEVVTMNSRVRLRDLDSDEEMAYTLVFPQDAQADEGRISVLSPIGTAILGYSVGDTIEWAVPAGMRRIKIVAVPYQPEAAGHYHL